MDDDTPDTTDGQAKAHAFTAPVRSRKADTALPVTRQMLREDSLLRELERNGSLLAPPFNPRGLTRLPQESSILGPCIDAMVQNCDGFGQDWVYRGREEQKDSSGAKSELAFLKTWLEYCNPVLSFTELRKRRRKDLETIGYAFWEILRDQQPGGGKPAQIEHVPANTMRLAMIDTTPQTIDMPYVDANGDFKTRKMRRHFRRFAQVQSRGIVWFKEFGDPRTYDVKTGDVVPEGTLPPDQTASEILYFARYDPSSAYGIPAYIGNLLSIRGGRQAELVNYLFFEKNAVPAMIITVAGAGLAKDSMRVINEFLRSETSGAANMHRILVIEAAPRPDQEERATISIDVKPLQSERQQDALFGQYIKDGRATTRESWRLPKLYTGDSDSYNRATAFAARITAEEQIFIPERAAFDDVMNRQLLPALGARFWRMASSGPELADPAEVAAIVQTFVDAGALTANAAIELANEFLGLELPAIDAPWANFPFKIIDTLATQGKLKGLEEVDRTFRDLSTTLDGATQNIDPNAPPAEGAALATDVAVQDTALNGAQIASLLDVVRAVNDGELDVEAAIALLVVAFPTIDSEEAGRILSGAAARAEEAKARSDAAPTPPPSPGNTPPDGAPVDNPPSGQANPFPPKPTQKADLDAAGQLLALALKSALPPARTVRVLADARGTRDQELTSLTRAVRSLHQKLDRMLRENKHAA